MKISELLEPTKKEDKEMLEFLEILEDMEKNTPDDINFIIKELNEECDAGISYKSI